MAMELGICVRDLPAAEVSRLGHLAEEQGYGYVFVPDVRGGMGDPAGRLGGRDCFVSLGAMFGSTSTVRGAVGVAAVPFHLPAALALTAATLSEQSEGRFLLGVGISHPESTRQHGIPFPDKPVAAMRQWVSELNSRSAGGLQFGGGFPVLVGALGERMVHLGAAEADGVVLNWLTPEHAAATVKRVRDAAAGSGRRGLAVLYVRLSPAAAVEADAVNYDALSNYHQHFVSQGLTSPGAIVAGTCLSAEDLGAARERIDAYAEAGIDVLCLYPHGFDEIERARMLTALSS
jgi:alkanesulfonate monooxygenase SsuD/methylene tetrahydromethanopterin reductase-like flavin-dependent oxidoreductase (luciferase family)